MAGKTSGVRVGQIIFDVNGEYANANHQDDGSSIAEVFVKDTIAIAPSIRREASLRTCERISIPSVLKR
jgi:hypothetical protein